VPVCDHCGAPIDLNGYHVVVAGRRYDSMECALRATSRSGRSDATNAWVAAARERLGVADEAPAKHEDDSVG
jgi:fructoselysine-6-P-deglycase FrlB-like protein